MIDPRTQQTWTSQLQSTTAALDGTPTISAIFGVLAQAWSTTAAVTQLASPATELGWMRLAEALFGAWSDLATLETPPGPIDSHPAPAGGALDDTPQLREAVARLLGAAAAALRGLSVAVDPRDGDAALAMSSTAATLGNAVEDWP